MNTKKFEEALLVTALSSIIVALYCFVSISFFGIPVSGVEIFATVFSLACVWLTRTENIWCWPTGILGVIFLGYYFLTINFILGQALLQLVYFLPIQFWGWYNWLYGGEQRTELKISKYSVEGQLTISFLWIFLSTIIGYYIVWFAPLSAFPMWDASIVAASIIAQILLTFKKLESWLFWLVPVNVSFILLMLVTGGYIFAMLYVCYLINALVATYQWWKVCER